MSAYERNCSFLNTLSSAEAEHRFATISAVTGLDFADDGRAAAVVDWDHDGKLDILLTNRNAPRVRVMRNESRSNNDFIQFRLLGNGNGTNRDAIGARISLELVSAADEQPIDESEPIRLIKTLRAGDGFLTQSSSWLHFGLGSGMRISRVEVRWPNRLGEVEVFEPMDANARYELKQGSGVATRFDMVRENLALRPSELKVPAPELTSRVPILHPIKAPALGYYDFDGLPHDFLLDGNTATLVNLWSVTCVPCVKELSEFTAQHNELNQAGVRVLALCIDELQSGPEARADAKAMAARLQFPFTAGMAPASVIDELTRRHNALFTMNRALPMPCSFLIDRAGRLSVVYKGLTDVATVTSDANLPESTLMQRFAQQSHFPGTILESEIFTGTMQEYHAAVLLLIAEDYMTQNRIDDALATLFEAYDVAPDSVAVLNELAIIKDLQGDSKAATNYYQQALQVQPDNPDLNVGLAQVLIREQQFIKAQALLEHAITKSPDHANAHYNMGLVFETKRDTHHARAAYEKTLEVKPHHPQALFRLGRLCESEQDLSQAKSYYQRAADAAPKEASVLTSLARLLIQDQEFQRAEQLLRDAIAANPRYAEARYHLGQLFVAKGDFPAARHQFTVTLQLDRNHRGAMTALGQLGNQ